MIDRAGRVFMALLLAVVAIIGTAAPDARAAAVETTGGPGDPLHRGPAVWIEEYWDVKPERFDEFVRTYRSEVYSVARRIHGYRGYTFLTNLPDADNRPRKGRTPDKMITTHYGIFLKGKLLTERAIDIGNLLRQTHNVVIVHHLQDWAEAGAFRQRMLELYAKEHGGENLWDHLAEKLFPMANNYWETPFRMIETGFDAAAAKPGNDADGLDLEPRPSDKGWFKEYFEVLPKDLDAFLDVYRNNTYAVMKDLPGYEGVTFVTSLPPGKAEAKRTRYRNELLGGPDSFYLPQPGVRIDGTVRTDTSINYSMLFRNTFTIITYYALPWNVDMLAGMQKNYERTNPGVDRIKHVTKVFAPLSQNHIGVVGGHVAEVQLRDPVERQARRDLHGAAARALHRLQHGVVDDLVEVRVRQQVRRVDVPQPAVVLLGRDALDERIADECLDHAVGSGFQVNDAAPSPKPSTRTCNGRILTPTSSATMLARSRSGALVQPRDAVQRGLALEDAHERVVVEELGVAADEHGPRDREVQVVDVRMVVARFR